MDPILKKITKLVPPPTSPVGLLRPWSTIENEIGLELPCDYKEFIDIYGSGRLCEEVVIWNFRSDLFSQIPIAEKLCNERSVVRYYDQLRSEGKHDWEYAMYPDPNGLLPFASLYDVHHLNWHTKGPASDWDIVYWHFDGLEFVHLHGVSFSQFLLNVLTHKYDSGELPQFDDEPFTFEPVAGW